MIPKSPKRYLLPLSVSAAQARRVMERPGVGKGFLSWLSQGRERHKLRAMELVYVPHWVCCFRLVVQRGKREQMIPAAHVLVNAMTGECAQVPDTPQFQQRSESEIDIPLLPDAVSSEHALQSATRAQSRDLVMQGARRKWRSIRVEHLETFLAYVPFWIGYFVADGGRVQVRAVHGIAGGLEKFAVVVAILQGLQTLETNRE